MRHSRVSLHFEEKNWNTINWDANDACSAVHIERLRKSTKDGIRGQPTKLRSGADNPIETSATRSYWFYVNVDMSCKHGRFSPQSAIFGKIWGQYGAFRRLERNQKKENHLNAISKMGTHSSGSAVHVYFQEALYRPQILPKIADWGEKRPCLQDMSTFT